MLYEAYKEFDKMGKGFITAADFRTVVHSCLPHLSTDTIDRIFSAADMYQVQKVILLFPLCSLLSVFAGLL